MLSYLATPWLTFAYDKFIDKKRNTSSQGANVAKPNTGGSGLDLG